MIWHFKSRFFVERRFSSCFIIIYGSVKSVMKITTFSELTKCLDKSETVNMYVIL
jgi:hypothetical protein